MEENNQKLTKEQLEREVAIQKQKKKRIQKQLDEKRRLEEEKINKKNQKAQEKEKTKKQKEEENLKKKSDKLKEQEEKKYKKEISIIRKNEKRRQENIQKELKRKEIIEKKEEKRLIEEQKEERKKRIEDKKKNRQVDFSFEEDENKRIKMSKNYNHDRQYRTFLKEKKKKSKVLKKIRIFLLIICLILIYIGYKFVRYSKFFKIDQIDVIGSNLTNIEDIRQLSNLYQTNIFAINDFKVEDEICKNPIIKYANIKRYFPNKIEIKLTERIPIFKTKLDDDIYIIDDQGYVILKYTNEYKNKININNLKNISGLKIENIGTRLNSSDLLKLETVYKIDEYLNIYGNSYSNINVDKYIFDNNNLALYIKNEQKIVYLLDSSNLSKKIITMFAILNDTKQKQGKIYLMEDFEKFKPYFREEELQIEE